MCIRDRDNNANKVSQGIINEGCNPDSRVAFLAKNSDHFCEFLYGTMKSRTVCVGINWRLAPPEVSYVLNDSKREILFIDDGSTDGSIELIKKLNQSDSAVDLVEFHRNYGKSAALSEGFKYAQGDYVVTMDADLQDDPAEIPNLILKLEEGYDLVSGWKKDRKDPLSKTIPSKLFNFVTRLVTGVKIHDFNCGLKIYRKAVVKTLEIYGGRHRYIPALAGQKKFNVSEIKVNHRPRIHGVTKYGGSRLFHGLFDLISILFLSKYTQSPLYFFGQIGLFTFLSGVGIELYAVSYTHLTLPTKA